MRNRTGEKNHRTGKSGYIKKFKITYPDNTFIIHNNLTEFCRVNDLPYNKTYHCVYKNIPMLLNEIKVILEFIKEPKAILTDSNGIDHDVYHIKNFCKEHDLYYQCVLHVLGGTKPQHKGWTGRRIK